MSRSLPVLLLATVLAACVGCGGGAAPESDAVATSSSSSGGGPASSGSQAPMPSAGGGGGGAMGDPGMMQPPGADDMSSMMAGMSSTRPDGMEDGMSPDMQMEMEMAMESYGREGAEGADVGMEDAAMMAEEYGAQREGFQGAAGGPSLEEMEANYGGPDGGFGGGVSEKIPDTLDGKAKWSFRRGNEKDAMQFLYAHALTTDEGAQSVLPTMRWVEGLREPRLAVRWGVGFVVTAPRNFNGDPKPVGTEQNIPSPGSKRRDGGSEGFAGGGDEAGYDVGDVGGGVGGGGSGKNALLEKGAGELGDKLLAGYTERVMRGDFGEVLKNAVAEADGGRGRSAGGPSYGAEGNYGAAGYAGGGPPGASSGRAQGGADAATEVAQITTGVSMLGIGDQRDLVDRAREDGIDAMIIIDMKLRVAPSNGLVTNESTFSLLDVKTQKKLHSTKKFNNLTVQKARAAGKDDGVDREIENLFEAIDASFKMTDLPEILNATVAARRVASLAAEKHDNPLPVLAEARMYHTRGLLDEATLFSTYEKILGVDSGRLLATGSPEEREKALSEWLPEL